MATNHVCTTGLPSTSEAVQPLDLSGNFEDLFHKGILSQGASPHTGTEPLFDSNAASTGVLSPAASGFIKCGSMLSASPLPASLIKCNSFFGSIDDILWSSSDKIDVLVTPDHKGKGRAYEPDQPLPSIAQSGPSRKRGRADSIDELKSSSISPIPDCKGKARAYELGQPRLLASGINVDCMV
ncbi:hypothetical protein BDR06DRAFT_1002931 [Suillus hirtellus]|nr:hypothetical protein BDR06DRAFT_1002931 [Suillus hirtellus]